MSCHKLLNFYDENTNSMPRYNRNTSHKNLTVQFQLCMFFICFLLWTNYIISNNFLVPGVKIKCSMCNPRNHSWLSHMAILYVRFNSSRRVQLAFSKLGLCFGVWHCTMTFLCSHTEVGESKSAMTLSHGETLKSPSMILFYWVLQLW